MKLTRLEIKGFKSFADRTIIDFQEGVTAIVGPNGCGKSNIVDAIRWVLGEQSTRTLRSEKMENVIFNGTEKRKSSHLAEVSLSFDNTQKILQTEYSQITLTRKLFRSGESEYRLNDIPCRLKDITDLFLDTGVGADSYSIIELRMVEELISNKEGSRRSLFEEAAGIAKYRVRKRQTHSKLKDTQDDLDRVEDVLFEIGKNLKSLEQQARRTEKYYRLKDQYQEMVVRISAQKIFNKRIDWLETEKLENKIKDELLYWNTQREIHESGLEKHKLNLLTKEKQLSVQQKVVNEFHNNLMKRENEQRFKNEKIQTLIERKEKIELEFHADLNSSYTLDLKKKTFEDSILPEKEKLNLLQTRLPVFQQKMGEIDLSQKSQKLAMEQLSIGIQKQKESAYRIEKEMDRIAIQKETLNGELSRNLQESEQNKTLIQEINLQVNKIQSQYSLNQDTLEEKRAKEQDLSERINNDEIGLEKNREENSNLSRRLDSLKNEYNLTKSLIDSLEGFPESIIFLKKKADWLKSIPLLSDIIFCPEEYRVAIENYLEPYMNFFVVRKRTEAEKAVHLLGESTKGRANFFILEEFVNSKPNPYTFPVDNKYDWVKAMDIIEVDPPYFPLVSYLLGGVILGKSAQEIFSPIEYPSLIFLEKRGVYYSSLQKLSGGSIGLFEGKRIGRAKNLEILQRDMDHLLKDLEKKNSEKTLLQERLQTQKTEKERLNLREAQTELSRIESERNNLVNKVQNLQNRLDGLLVRKEELLLEDSKLDHRHLSLVPDLEQLKTSLISLESESKEMQKQYDETGQTYKILSTEYNAVNLEFHQVLNRIQSLEKEIEFHENQIESIGSRMDRQKIELEQIEKELIELRKLETVNDGEFQALYEEKSNLDQGLKEIEEEFYQIRTSIQDQEKIILEVRKSREQKEVDLAQLKEKRTGLGFELKTIEDRMIVEFSINPEDWQARMDQANKNDLINEEELKLLGEQSQKLKIQLDNFGAINPLAMEAFGEIQTRFDFIVSQKEDLLKAKASLLETISEIDETAKEKFLTAFTSVRDNFVKVFRTLFNEEDSCDLILLNPENPLDSDIEILARPKGKRPLTINQLSGGEKTLTATAILFSLYLLKPAPFCIFDEVDAPLDDTNIEKFNSIIRKFSNNSQFIVVSHNKKTISSTDIIYGVTMAEMGISKIVAVDLRNVENAA